MRLTPPRRSLALPDDVKALIPWERGERVLAVAADAAGRYLVATDRDLVLQRYPPEYSRLGWEVIDKAVFDDDSLRVTLHTTEGDVARLRIPISTPGHLAEVVRERVTASIVVSTHVALRGERGVRVTARRRPDEDELSWWGAIDEALQPADEALRQEASEAVSRVRQTLGLDV